jgi:hypothetical protein
MQHESVSILEKKNERNKSYLICKEDFLTIDDLLAARRMEVEV